MWRVPHCLITYELKANMIRLRWLRMTLNKLVKKKSSAFYSAKAKFAE